MKRISVSVAFIAAVLASGHILIAQEASSLNLDGREVVIRIFRRELQGRPQYEDRTVPIKDGTFQLSEDDLTESVGIEVPSRLQKDPLVKKQIGRGFCSYRAWEGPVFHLPFREDELEAREVVIRAYMNRQLDPTYPSKAVLAIKGGTITFSFDDANEPALVAVFGEDQKDELVRRILGERVYGWAYKKGLKFRLPVKVAVNKNEDFCWTFLDALGNPIPAAPVDVWLSHARHTALIFRTTTDSTGSFVLPFCPSQGDAFLRIGPTTHHYGNAHFRFVISHFYYGLCVVEVYPDDNNKIGHTVPAPAVPAGSEADQRSIWGVVRDSDDNPVPGLLVEVSGIYPLGANWIGSTRYQRCGVLTDDQGRFRLYLPIREDSWAIGTLVPPKSKYYTLIRPPQRFGLLPFKGKIPNGQRAVITLEQRAGYFRTFVFEDENGPITDPNLLRQIHVSIKRPGKERLGFKYEHLREGGLFPLGTFGAGLSRDRPLKFEPIEVTIETPEQLHFKIPSTEMLYYGRVVDGITGEPMPGVFIANVEAICSQRNLSMLTDEQWDGLHSLPSASSFSNKAVAQILRPVDNCYSFSKIVRTNTDGWFELKMPSKLYVSKLVIFEQDYISVLIDDTRFKQIDEVSFELPVTKMFPAAKVIVEPVAEGHGIYRPPRPWPKWIMGKEEDPVWIQDLVDSYIDDSMDGIRKDMCLDTNHGPQSFYVPAGLNLHLQFWVEHRRGKAKNGWAPCTIAENIRLKQGEVFDLGRRKIQRSLKVFIEIVNSAGAPVEGIPVTVLCQYGDTTHNTDEYGFAAFDIAPDAKGEFVIEYKGDDSTVPQLRQAIPYQVAGPEDANSVFTMTASEELLYQLFK